MGRDHASRPHAAESAGIVAALDRLEKRLVKHRQALADVIASEGASGRYAETEVTEAEVETVERLIEALAKRVTGREPEVSAWERMHSYCSRKEKKGLPDFYAQNYEYFRWAIMWIEMARTYVQFLAGYGPLPASDEESRNDDAKTANEFDVALSFAGEDRRDAESIAGMLTREGFSVYYDEYVTAQVWGQRLTEHLSNVYGRRAKFCVIFVSKNYAKKVWPRVELEAALRRSYEENREYILPLRLDDSDLPEIADDVHYVDLRDAGYDRVVSLLKEKLSAAD